MSVILRKQESVIVSETVIRSLVMPSSDYQSVPVERHIKEDRSSKIGEGVYGQVYDEKDNKGHVVKIFEDSDEITAGMVREVSTLSLISNHPFVVDLKAICFDIKPPRISLTKYTGNLTKLSSPSESTVRAILFKLISVLSLLSNYNLAHRDLKLENILFGEDKEDVVVCDFGFVRFAGYPYGDHMTPIIQPLWYRAPEVIIYPGHYDMEKVDVWSLGIAIITLIRGSYLQNADDEFQQLACIAKTFGTPATIGSKYHGNIPLYERKNMYEITDRLCFSKDLMDVLDMMTEVDPRKRANLCTLLQHPYFGVNKSISKLSPMSRLNVLLEHEKYDNDKVLEYKHRNDVIDMIFWLYDNDCHSNPETPFAAILYMDLYISKPDFNHDVDPNLLAVVTMTLAAKVHERDLASMESVTEHLKIDYLMAVNLELDIFKKLNYMVFLPTAMTYIKTKWPGSVKNNFQKLRKDIKTVRSVQEQLVFLGI